LFPPLSTRGSNKADDDIAGELPPSINACPISEPDRMKIGHTNARHCLQSAAAGQSGPKHGNYSLLPH
jgi:hypothetical protein